jgi:hypothetical protein
MHSKVRYSSSRILWEESLTMICKMILGILDDEDLATNKPEGWLYVG